ncbi:MAG: lactam utilization protein LamB, partial [Pricia sp.]|nr:lactam utilization protein LamB [Pricia sp.]
MDSYKEIDINCDVGEGIGNEAELFPLISSCNIACGGHAGNTKEMKEIVQLAKLHKVKVGAHPSYPDKAKFGRVSMDITADGLTQSIRRQIENLVRIASKAQIGLNHIKPHGALYNDIAKNESLTNIFLKAIAAYRTDVHLYVPYASV